MRKRISLRTRVRKSAWFVVPLAFSAIALTTGVYPFTHNFQQQYATIPTVTIDSSCQFGTKLEVTTRKDGSIRLISRQGNGAEPCQFLETKASIDDPDARVTVTGIGVVRKYVDPNEAEEDRGSVAITRSLMEFSIPRERLNRFAQDEPETRDNCENPFGDDDDLTPYFGISISDAAGTSCLFRKAGDFPISSYDRKMLSAEISTNYFGAHGPEDQAENEEFADRVNTKVKAIEKALPQFDSVRFAIDDVLP